MFLHEQTIQFGNESRLLYYTYSITISKKVIKIDSGLKLINEYLTKLAYGCIIIPIYNLTC